MWIVAPKPIKSTADFMKVNSFVQQEFIGWTFCVETYAKSVNKTKVQLWKIVTKKVTKNNHYAQWAGLSWGTCLLTISFAVDLSIYFASWAGSFNLHLCAHKAQLKIPC